jgi:hypothetical protein
VKGFGLDAKIWWNFSLPIVGLFGPVGALLDKPEFTFRGPPLLTHVKL